jgi:hypothetical protein
MVKMVKVLVAGAEAASMLGFDAVIAVAAFVEGVCTAFRVNRSLLIETDDEVEIEAFEMVVDVESDAAKAVSKAELTEVLENLMLSFSAVPFHTTLHELVLKLVGS